MGYYTRLRGDLDITPAISVDDVGHRFLDEHRSSFWFRKEHDGMIHAIDIYEDQFKAYYIDDEIKGIIAEVERLGSKVSGEVEGFGEDSTDIWRFIVDNNSITKETAETRWPDGTKVESNY